MVAKKIIKNGDMENAATDDMNAGNGTVDVGGGVRPSGAAGDVWDALTGDPGATVAALAEASGVSRATVARTLTTFEGEGRATRTRGGRDGGKRQPDTWHPVTDDDTPTATPVTTDAQSTDDTTAGENAPTGAPTADTSTGADTAGDPGTGMDEAAVAEARDALTALRDAITLALTGLDAGDGAAALTAVEAVYGGSGRTRRLVRAAANGRPRTASGVPRSAPGEMRAKVAGHLTAHPGAAFTPHEIAKVIGHSAGAVSNALDRLTEAGDAELVCERPRRFTTIARPAARAAR